MGTRPSWRMTVEPRLSAREDQVARLVWAENSNLAIADALSVAPSTVRAHLRIIYGKIGCASRLELALWYEREIGRTDSPSDDGQGLANEGS